MQQSRLLLVAGLAAVGLYGLGDLLSGLSYPGYSFRDQAISELTAIGSPVRPWMVAVIVAHSLLLIAFGVGLWRWGDRRSARLAGLFLAAANATGLVLHPFFPMHSRGMATGFTDALHETLTAAFSLLVFAAIALVAIGRGGWFRFYSIVTIVILAGFGTLSSLTIPEIIANLPTPWMGAFERVNAYAYLGWVAVLALVVIRSHRGAQ